MSFYVLQQRSTNPESAFQRWMPVSDVYHLVYTTALWELIMERMGDGALCLSEWEYRIVESGA